MRSAFIKTLEKLAEKNNNLFLLTADLGFKLFDTFRKKYAERFINVGVAEQNMIGVAAGLALSGKNVYCYSIASFLLRCIEQIKIDLCYQNLNVKLIGVGGGLVYGLEGVTHHSIEDISFMGYLPNMTVVAPGDPLEAEAVAGESINYNGPIYIRLGRSGEPQVHTNLNNFRIGKGIILSEGADVALISTGNMLHTAKVVSDELKNKGLNVTLISMHTIKPLDEGLVKRCAKNSKAIFTIEEHSVIGGLGSSISEILSNLEYKGLFRKLALPDRYCSNIGKHEYLREIHSLIPKLVTKRILKEYKMQIER